MPNDSAFAGRVTTLHRAYLIDHQQDDLPAQARALLAESFVSASKTWAAWQGERRQAGVSYRAARKWFDQAFPIAS